jgi:hypothetical protein
VALSKLQSNSIADGAITAADLASSAISDKLGFTPANASTALTSITRGYILSNTVGNVNIGSANTWTDVNNSVYKWDLPSAGTYFLYTTIRTRLWGLTGFIKCRLYDVTNNNTGNTLEKMLQEFQNTTTNNIQLTPVWNVQVAGATTFKLQMFATNSGEIGIQSDGNGWNETGWIKFS